MARGRPSQQASDDTRNRILDATIETLRVEGIVGTSARAIARTGDFNQALIFYHFGSITEVLAEALHRIGQERMLRYEARLRNVTTLSDFVRIGAELHHEDKENGGITVLTQILAGSCGDADLSARMAEPFRPWTELVRDAIDRVLAGSPFVGLVSTEDLAFALSSLFIGIELLSSIDPDHSREDSLFETLAGLAVLLSPFLEAPDRAIAPADDGVSAT